VRNTPPRSRAKVNGRPHLGKSKSELRRREKRFKWISAYRLSLITIVLCLIPLDSGQSYASRNSLLRLCSPSGYLPPLSTLWWSRSTELLGLWVLLIVVLLALAWVVSLRRVERKQTAILHTLRKEEEKALRGSEERFRHLAENMRDIVWIVSLDSRVTLFVNSAFEKITGRTCQSLYDRPNCLDLIHPEDRAQVVATLFKQVLEGYEGDAEFRIVLHDGAIRWLSLIHI